MGGKIFGEVKRFDKSTLNDMSVRIINILRNNCYEVCATLYVDSKVSFGDLDILVYLDDVEQLEPLKELIDHDKYTLNNDTLSMLIDGYQVDLIYVNNCYKDLATTFYNYSIYGFMIDRMLRDFNLKITTTGLQYIYNDTVGNRVYFHVTSRDRTFEILKLDKDVYSKGFNSYDDLFEYVSTSPYFRKEIYYPENLTHSSRARANKREPYHLLLKWLEDKSKFRRPDKKYQLPEGLRHIINDEVYSYEVMLERKNELKKSFNGNIIQKLTGLSGIELGDFKNMMLSKYTHDELCNNTESLIMKEMNSKE